jgi:hypothetical protein
MWQNLLDNELFGNHCLGFGRTKNVGANSDKDEGFWILWDVLPTPKTGCLL